MMKVQILWSKILTNEVEDQLSLGDHHGQRVTGGSADEVGAEMLPAKRGHRQPVGDDDDSRRLRHLPRVVHHRVSQQPDDTGWGPA